MKKKFSIKKVIILSLILLFSYVYGQYNIRHYSIYYARNNTELKKIDSDMLMILKNWWLFKIPIKSGNEKNRIIDSFSYSYRNEISGEYEVVTDGMTETDEENGITYTYIVFLQDKSTTYVFDMKRRVVWCSSNIQSESNSFLDKNPYNPQKEKEVYNKVRNLIKPILDANSEPPLINLQWLFDMKYEDYLN